MLLASLACWIESNVHEGSSYEIENEIHGLVSSTYFALVVLAVPILRTILSTELEEGLTF
jgi:hypothetical protein